MPKLEKARSAVASLGREVNFVLVNNDLGDLSRGAVVFIAVLIAFTSIRAYTHYATQLKLKEGEEPGMLLRTLALFNPFCAFSGSMRSVACPCESTSEPGKSNAQRPGPKRRVSMRIRRSGGVLFAHKSQMLAYTKSAPFLRYGLYASTEIAIAVTVATMLALSLTPVLDNTTESILIVLVGYRLLSPASAALAALVKGGTIDPTDTIEKTMVEGVTHTTLDLMSFVLRGSIWLLGLSVFMAWLGYEMTTLVSFFGIGGLSIGLASQAILKDLLGTTILVFDEWFDVGSKITVDGIQGHVEDFGMRSTKIRLVKDGEAMHVPNSKLACSMVINGDDIKSRRIQLDVWLAGDTSHAVLVKFITGLSDDLEEHESITRSAAHYMDMDPTLGILLEIIYYVEPGSDVALSKQARTFVTLLIKARMEKHRITFGYSRAMVKMLGQHDKSPSTAFNATHQEASIDV